MSQEISFSKAVEGYLLYAHSRRLSPHTIRDYNTTFNKLGAFLAPADPALAGISLEQLEEFFSSLDHLSKKTIVNYHAGLCALWTWALKRRIVDEHVPRMYDPPRPEDTVIEIFTEDEVQRLLYACNRTRSYRRPRKRKCSNSRPTELRDKAIILTLLDSLVRISELCLMKQSDTDLKTGTIKVKGKRDKERFVQISHETADAIWQYLATRPEPKPKYLDYLFLTNQGRPLNKDAVGMLMRRLSSKTGIQANAHKFRHTGATLFLRNGGNAFALQAILGHSTMTMVERYVHLAQVDIEEAHRRASPVYNWDLKT